MDQLHFPGSGPIAAATAPFFVALDHTASISTLQPESGLAPPFPANESGSDTIKARIMSHPLYPALLRAFIDCQKVNTISILLPDVSYFSTLLISRYLRSELHRKLLVGSRLSPTSSSQIQMTCRRRNSPLTPSSTSSW
jgi:hypothetical protein